MIVAFDYASPSTFESDRAQAQLGLAANAVRPVRFHGRIQRNTPLLRFALRALGEAVWSDDTWQAQGEFGSWVLDPVITVHPDRLCFEAFSQDQSVYAMLLVNPSLFVTEGEVRGGTTNVDFTAWLWGALGELRSSRETWLRIEPGGFEVKTKGAGGRHQEKVELPDSWVRGFLQVSSAMAMPGTRLTVRPVDLLAAIRFLRYTKAKLSPRALRYEFLPEQEARLVLEPWEQVFPLRGTTHGYTAPRIVRTWGRRRLKLIEPLLPFAQSVDIYLKGRGLPSFYAVKLPDLTFVLGLSGWSEQSWTEAGRFDLLGQAGTADPALLERLHQQMVESHVVDPPQLATAWGLARSQVEAACLRLCRQGRAMFDVESRAFRHRELLASPIDEASLFPPDERVERAQALLAQKAVHFAHCEPQETRKTRRLKTPAGPVDREIIYRDWRVTGSVGTEKRTEIVVGDRGTMIFGTCTCRFFQENLLGQGPCEHMLALWQASAAERQDAPTSVPAATGSVGQPPARPAAEDDSAEEEAAEENEDDDSFDDQAEGEQREGR